MKDKRSFTHACQIAGIEDFRFHDLRHTFASWLMQAGAALVEVRDLLGHASVEMTERYARIWRRTLARGGGAAGGPEMSPVRSCPSCPLLSTSRAEGLTKTKLSA
ncbi:MAG: tyrosine-type recombinase/integrase [Candidatus Competibacteraceae bacterium]